MEGTEFQTRNLLAEFLGTAFLIFAALGSIVLANQVMGADLPLSVFINAIAVGFILFALIETFGPISGAHFNPAVTLALLSSKEISRRKASFYIASQLSGAMVGVLMVNLLFFDTTQALFIISDNDKLTAATYLSEIVGTFLLVAVIYGCVRGGSDKTSLAVGLMVGGMIMATSSNMFANPAINLSRIFTDSIAGIAPTTALIWASAQIIGALTAAYVMSYLYPTKLSPKGSSGGGRPAAQCSAFDCTQNGGREEAPCAPFDCKDREPIEPQ